MTEHGRHAAFRHPKSTVTGVLQSAAFLHSRERAGAIIDDPAALRELANAVETLDHANQALFAIWDRVAAAVRLVRARADRVESDNEENSASRLAAGRNDEQPAGPGSAARERLIVAALHYLITPVDLIPDFRAGGYLDDALLLSWVFGVADKELKPLLAGHPNS
jgi:uncharacterized membrane protein YkvA (DUF1232 family)